MADSNGSCHGLTPSFLEQMTHCQCQKHHLRLPSNLNDRSKFRKYHAYLPILGLRDRDWCSTADCNGSCHGLTPSFFEKMTHCRRQKHHRSRPGNSNGWLKFHKYCTYLPILHLRDRNWCSAADGGFRRSLKQHVADVKKHRRRWPGNPKDQLKFHNYQNLMPTRSSKTSRKTYFSAWTPPLWCHCALFFFLLSLATAFVIAY